MIALIKNHRHNSKTYVCIEYDSHGALNRIIKSSSHATGINNISSEIRGLNWYNDITGCLIKYDTYHIEETYIYLSIEIIKDLVNTKNTPSYSNYIKYIPKVISHYCDVWSEVNSDGRFSMLHGDLSLVGNVLFNNINSPIFIDWEHFHEHIAPVGFDALYCMFELIQFEIINENRLLDENLEHLLTMIKILRSRECIDCYLLDSPLESTINFMKDHDYLWGDQYSKFPILLFSDYHISYIDNYLNDKIQYHVL